jgi:hypothetical protein
VRLPNADYELAENAVGLGVFAKRELPKNLQFCALTWGPVREEPWRHSIQIGPHAHAEPLPEFLRYLNHSCDPNVFIDLREGAVVTLREIAQGEELTFFYPSTEWNMEAPFPCECGAAECLQEIRGASELPARVLARYRLSPVIMGLITYASSSGEGLSATPGAE